MTKNNRPCSYTAKEDVFGSIHIFFRKIKYGKRLERNLHMYCYKFKHSKEWSRISTEGRNVICASELKKLVVQSRQLRSKDFQLFVHNHSNGELYEDHQEIPRNTAVVLSRIATKTNPQNATQQGDLQRDVEEDLFVQNMLKNVREEWTYKQKKTKKTKKTEEPQVKGPGKGHLMVKRKESLKPPTGIPEACLQRVDKEDPTTTTYQKEDGSLWIYIQPKGSFFR